MYFFFAQVVGRFGREEEGEVELASEVRKYVCLGRDGPRLRKASSSPSRHVYATLDQLSHKVRPHFASMYDGVNSILSCVS
jgi:hypothetical protein